MAETRYLPYGEVRWPAGGAQPTDFTFTGQRAERGFGLMDYRACYYDPRLGRFISADTVVPDYQNPQSLNRCTYAHNNPVRYYDSDGHCLPFCATPVLLWLAFDYLPRETIAGWSREIAEGGVVGVSDLAALDAYAADQLWLAVNGDELGLTTKERVDAAGEGYIALLQETSAIVSVAVGVQVTSKVAKGVLGEIAVRTGRYPGASADAARFAEEQGITIKPGSSTKWAGRNIDANSFEVSGYNAATKLPSKSVEENLGRTLIHECQHCLDLRAMGTQSRPLYNTVLHDLMEASALAAEEAWAIAHGFLE